MNTSNTVKLSPYSAASEAEKAGDFTTAARLFQQAGDMAGGRTFASQCYALAKDCEQRSKQTR